MIQIAIATIVLLLNPAHLHKVHHHMSIEDMLKDSASRNYDFATDEISKKHLLEVKPALAEKVIPILESLEDEGWEPRVVEGLRTMAQEREKVRLGYSHTMHSKHLTGDAVDVVDKRYGWDHVASNLGYEYWREQGKLVDHTPGLTWGGDWGRGYARYEALLRDEVSYFADVAHIQLNVGANDE